MKTTTTQNGRKNQRIVTLQLLAIGMEVGWFNARENFSGAKAFCRFGKCVWSGWKCTCHAFSEHNTSNCWFDYLFAASCFPLQLSHIKTWSVIKITYEEASQVDKDAVRGIKTVALLGAEEKLMLLYKKKFEGQTRTRIRQVLVSSLVRTVLTFFYAIKYIYA